MYITTTEASNLKKIFCKCDLTPRESGNLVGFLKHLEHHKGIKFVVQYMKQLKSDILRGRMTHKYKGQSQILIRLSLRSRRGRRSAMRALSQYGRWKSPEPKRADYIRFRDVVASPPTKYRRNLLKFTHEQERRLLLASTYSRFNFSPLNSPSTHILGSNKTSKGPPQLIEDLLSLGDSGRLVDEYEDMIVRVFNLTPDFVSYLKFKSFCQKQQGRSFIGRVVGLTKDRGLKVRFVANLMKPWQVLLSPLIDPFEQFLKGEEMSAHKDQLGAVNWMIEELNAGKVITSVDLTSATDFLPLYLFEDLLMSFIQSYGAELDRKFTEAFFLDMALCRSSYYTPYDGVEVNYGTGQAMGRWSSKKELDITMILLAQHCGASGSNSRVNGDDIFFSDNKVASKFLRLLKRLKIPISPMKTYFAKPFGEFSGVIADKYGSLEIFKASILDVKEDPLGPLRQFGPTGITLVPTEHRKAIWAFACLPEPYGVESVRQFTRYPYDGFKPKVSTRKIELTSWEVSWVEQEFSTEKEAILLKRIDRLKRLMSVAPSSKSFNVFKEAFEDNCDQLVRLRGPRLVKGSALQRFSEPSNTRLRLFVDNMNAQTVRTSDGWTIEGYGDEELDGFQQRLVEKRVTFTNQYEKAIRPKTRISFIWRVYKQLRRFTRVTLPKIFK